MASLLDTLKQAANAVGQKVGEAAEYIGKPVLDTYNAVTSGKTSKGETVGEALSKAPERVGKSLLSSIKSVVSEPTKIVTTPVKTGLGFLGEMRKTADDMKNIPGIGKYLPTGIFAYNNEEADNDKKGIDDLVSTGQVNSLIGSTAKALIDMPIASHFAKPLIGMVVSGKVPNANEGLNIVSKQVMGIMGSLQPLVTGIMQGTYQQTGLDKALETANQNISKKLYKNLKNLGVSEEDVTTAVDTTQNLIGALAGAFGGKYEAKKGGVKGFAGNVGIQATPDVATLVAGELTKEDGKTNIGDLSKKTAMASLAAGLPEYKGAKDVIKGLKKKTKTPTNNLVIEEAGGTSGTPLDQIKDKTPVKAKNTKQEKLETLNKKASALIEASAQPVQETRFRPEKLKLELEKEKAGGYTSPLRKDQFYIEAFKKADEGSTATAGRRFETPAHELLHTDYTKANKKNQFKSFKEYIGKTYGVVNKETGQYDFNVGIKKALDKANKKLGTPTETKAETPTSKPTNTEFDNYVKTGKVSEAKIQELADRIQKGDTKFTPEEVQMAGDVMPQIKEILIQRTKEKAVESNKGISDHIATYRGAGSEGVQTLYNVMHDGYNIDFESIKDAKDYIARAKKGEVTSPEDDAIYSRSSYAESKKAPMQHTADILEKQTPVTTTSDTRKRGQLLGRKAQPGQKVTQDLGDSIHIAGVGKVSKESLKKSIEEGVNQDNIRIPASLDELPQPKGLIGPHGGKLVVEYGWDDVNNAPDRNHVIVVERDGANLADSKVLMTYNFQSKDKAYKFLDEYKKIGTVNKEGPIIKPDIQQVERLYDAIYEGKETYIATPKKESLLEIKKRQARAGAVKGEVKLPRGTTYTKNEKGKVVEAKIPLQKNFALEQNVSKTEKGKIPEPMIRPETETGYVDKNAAKIYLSDKAIPDTAKPFGEQNKATQIYTILQDKTAPQRGEILKFFSDKIYPEFAKLKNDVERARFIDSKIWPQDVNVEGYESRSFRADAVKKILSKYVTKHEREFKVAMNPKVGESEVVGSQYGSTRYQDTKKWQGDATKSGKAVTTGIADIEVLQKARADRERANMIANKLRAKQATQTQNNISGKMSKGQKIIAKMRAKADKLIEKTNKTKTEEEAIKKLKAQIKAREKIINDLKKIAEQTILKDNIKENPIKDKTKESPIQEKQSPIEGGEERKGEAKLAKFINETNDVNVLIAKKDTMIHQWKKDMIQAKIDALQGKNIASPKQATISEPNPSLAPSAPMPPKGFMEQPLKEAPLNPFASKEGTDVSQPKEERETIKQLRSRLSAMSPEELKAFEESSKNIEDEKERKRTLNAINAVKTDIAIANNDIKSAADIIKGNSFDESIEFDTAPSASTIGRLTKSLNLDTFLNNIRVFKDGKYLGTMSKIVQSLKNTGKQVANKLITDFGIGGAIKSGMKSAGLNDTYSKVMSDLDGNKELLIGKVTQNEQIPITKDNVKHVIDTIKEDGDKFDVSGTFGHEFPQSDLSKLMKLSAVYELNKGDQAMLDKYFSPDMQKVLKDISDFNAEMNKQTGGYMVSTGDMEAYELTPAYIRYIMTPEGRKRFKALTGEDMPEKFTTSDGMVFDNIFDMQMHLKRNSAKGKVIEPTKDVAAFISILKDKTSGLDLFRFNSPVAQALDYARNFGELQKMNAIFNAFGALDASKNKNVNAFTKGMYTGKILDNALEQTLNLGKKSFTDVPVSIGTKAAMIGGIKTMVQALTQGAFRSIVLGKNPFKAISLTKNLTPESKNILQQHGIIQHFELGGMKGIDTSKMVSLFGGTPIENAQKAAVSIPVIKQVVEAVRGKSFTGDDNALIKDFDDIMTKSSFADRQAIMDTIYDYTNYLGNVSSSARSRITPLRRLGFTALKSFDSNMIGQAVQGMQKLYGQIKEGTGKTKKTVGGTEIGQGTTQEVMKLLAPVLAYYGIAYVASQTGKTQEEKDLNWAIYKDIAHRMIGNPFVNMYNYFGNQVSNIGNIPFEFALETINTLIAMKDLPNADERMKVGINNLITFLGKRVQAGNLANQVTKMTTGKSLLERASKGLGVASREDQTGKLNATGMKMDNSLEAFSRIMGLNNDAATRNYLYQVVRNQELDSLDPVSRELYKFVKSNYDNASRGLSQSYFNIPGVLDKVGQESYMKALVNQNYAAKVLDNMDGNTTLEEFLDKNGLGGQDLVDEFKHGQYKNMESIRSVNKDMEKFIKQGMIYNELTGTTFSEKLQDMRQKNPVLFNNMIAAIAKTKRMLDEGKFTDNPRMIMSELQKNFTSDTSIDAAISAITGDEANTTDIGEAIKLSLQNMREEVKGPNGVEKGKEILDKIEKTIKIVNNNSQYTNGLVKSIALSTTALQTILSDLEKMGYRNISKDYPELTETIKNALKYRGEKENESKDITPQSYDTGEGNSLLKLLQSNQLAGLPQKQQKQQKNLLLIKSEKPQKATPLLSDDQMPQSGSLLQEVLKNRSTRP